MQASLLPNGHLVGTSEASRQSLSQSPVLGRHGNKQRGARQMGERSQREAGRCTIISDPVTCSGHDTQPCGHPLCFTDQRTHSLLPSSVPLTQTGSTSPHTHIHRLTHFPPTHTTHTPITHPHSPTLTHTYFSHSSHTPQIHTLFTPTNTLTHTHPHTLTHTHSSYPHTHTPSHTPYLHTYTHTITEPTGAKTQETQGPRGSAHTPGTWSVWEQPRVPAEPSHWTFYTLRATGTPRSSLKTRETVEGT